MERVVWGLALYRQQIDGGMGGEMSLVQVTQPDKSVHGQQTSLNDKHLFLKLQCKSADNTSTFHSHN